MTNRCRYDFTAGWSHTSHLEHEQRKIWLSWVQFWLVWGPKGADLGCQDREWVGGNGIEDLDAIVLQDGLILATLSMDEGKCCHLGCISG